MQLEQRPDLTLASASPRRRELLERLGLRLRVAPADVDETPRAGEPAAEYVRRMALDKLAAARSAATADEVAVLAADTIVVLQGAILGKPRDEDDARAMLRRLAGHRHEVLTAYRIALGAREVERTVTTGVAFRLIDPPELEAYIGSREWSGKAGGYAVQGVAAVFVTELRGSLTNVVGLPLAEVLADLRALGALPAYPPAAYPTLA
ncbi:MAG TPA: Maf family protein [Polyangia bacterium]|nr:Maf family protein [Polyangia bacterium]